MYKLAQVDIGNAFGSKFGQTQGFGNLVSILLSNAMIIAGIIILFILLFGGFSFIMGAGSGNAEQAEKGKKAITGAVAGFVVIFAAYWIIQAIEAMTGLHILNPGF